MFVKSSLAKSVRLAVVFGAAATLAQPAVAAEEGNDEGSEVEKIVVTGSRIARPEFTQPAPIVSIGSDEIAKFGNVDLGSILAELPAISSTDTIIGNNNSNALAGVSSADLRGLETKRTLVLVNGKRHVAGAEGSAQVDLTTIPSALVERVEVITGGASAIYGSDAVSGVINVILKDNFEGFEFDVSLGDSTEGVDTKSHTISLLGGADLSDGRGNVTFFANYDRTKEVMSTQLRQLDGWGTISNPENTGEDDGIPDRLRVPRVYSELINDSGVLNPFGGGTLWTFDQNGTPMLQTLREEENSFAFGNFPNGCDTCFNPEEYENYVPGVERITVGSTFNYDLTDNVEFYSDFKYVSSEIKQQFQPSFRFGNVFINVEDNAFLDEGLRQTLLDDGQTNVRMAKFFDELGNRSADNQRDLFRFVGGFKGDFTLSETDFNWELFYVWGETRNTRKTLNDLIPDNLVAALDSVIDPDTGEAACRSQVPSAQGDGYEDPASVNGDQCVAYNPFGFGQASEAARDFVSADVTRNDKITQQVMGATLATDSSELFELPGGPVDVVVGWEYREETSTTTTDEFTKAGFLAGAATPDAYGEYDVTEYFIEVRLPLVQGMTGIEELTLDGAFRGADYSHAGTADAWKVGAFYSPFDGLSFRGTIGEAVRAPNINEAFSPQSPGFQRVSDPCDADNITDDPDRAANCAALGIPPGWQANDNVSVDTLTGGNPDLISETSESQTFGFVWNPNFLEDFTLTVDYYDIQIEDAITSVSAQQVADNCVDASGSPDANFCGQVDRDPDTFDITLVRSGFVNASKLETQGVEFQAAYSMDLYEGDLSLALTGNHLIEWKEFIFQNRPDEVDNDEGQVGNPEWQFRFSANYRWEDMSVNWVTRFIDNSVTYDVTPGPSGGSPEDLSPHYVPTMFTHDLGGTYVFNDTVELRAGIRNLFDKLPPGYTVNPIYDLVGRRYYVGLNVKL